MGGVLILVFLAARLSAGISASVSLAGPGEHFIETLPTPPHARYYTYLASGSYALTIDIEQEVQDGDASVSEEYSWEYPGQCDAGGGSQDSFVCICFNWNEVPGGTISVTYTATVTYADGTSSSASASASIDAVFPVWETGSAISCEGITAPVSGARVAMGEEVNCSISPAADNDTRIGATIDTARPDAFSASGAYSWSASAGSFKDGCSTGLSVTWIAPSASGEATITGAAADDAVIPDGEGGTRDDSDYTDTASVIVVKIDRLECEDVTSTTNNPGNNETVYLPVGFNDGTVTVNAFPDPEGEWPNGKPAWSGDIQSSSGSTATVDTTTPGIKTVAAECGNIIKIKICVLEVDLDVDSNNDGIINDTDDSLEANAPGKLVYLNHDDDNMNDVEDKTENSTAVTNENDLQPMNLSFAPPTLSVGKIILSATSGASYIQVWKSATKGTAADKVALPKTWTLGTDTVPSTLYVEGSDTGDVTLKLAYEVNSSEICKDEVKMGVVKIDFKERSDTKYGYDDGTVDDNPVPTSADNPPQKYDWVSIDKNMKTTDVDVEITPPAYAQYVHFVASDTEKATCVPTQASSSPQKLTLTGKGIGKSYIQTRLGTTSGAEGVRLNVACYQLAEIKADFYKVKTTTGLVPDATTAAELESGANEYMKRGVSELELTDKGTSTIDYDDDNNSMLDIDTTVTGGGSEWNKIETGLNASQTGLKLLHVKALCVKIGSTWINASGLAYDDWLIVTDASLSKKRTVAHEMLHILDLKDVGPDGNNTANIMYYRSSKTKYFVGYFKVERVQTGSGTSYNPEQHESQWDAIQRPD
ncbi:MAG TPA: hypothetical protein PLT23_00740 [Lentisphaeria bacterium]|nr:hypothetical protein [Lentisphaeria bacterium]